MNTVKFYDNAGAFTYEKPMSEITPKYCQEIKKHFFYGGYCKVEGKKVANHNTLEELCKPHNNTIDIIVAFTQEGQHIHSWETDSKKLEVGNMLDAARCTGLVDDTKPLDYIVYTDNEEDVVLLEGSFKPELITLY